MIVSRLRCVGTLAEVSARASLRLLANSSTTSSLVSSRQALAGSLVLSQERYHKIIITRQGPAANFKPRDPVGPRIYKRTQKEQEEFILQCGQGVMMALALKAMNAVSNQTIINARATKIYNICEQAANSEELIKVCGFKRDYAAWYKLTVMHMWMYFSRIRGAGTSSQEIHQAVLDLFWTRAEDYLLQSGVTRGMLFAKYMKKNSQLLYAFQIGLDISMRDGDQALAACLWRHLFFQEDVSAAQLKALVRYIHKQLYVLDRFEHADILTGEFDFDPYVN